MAKKQKRKKPARKPLKKAVRKSKRRATAAPIFPAGGMNHC